MASLYRIQTRLVGIPGGEGLTTFHFRAADGSGDAAVTAVAAFWNAVDSHISSTVTMVGTGEIITFEDTTGTISSITPYVPFSVPGLVAGDVLPDATAGLLRWRTNSVVAGRRLQGRTFMPKPVEAESTNGNPNGTYQLDVRAAGTALVGAADATLVVWARPVPGVRPGASGDVVDASVWGEWAVLRSRRG